MSKNGVKTVGFIGFNDPYGENWFKVFGGLAEKAGISIVASERYARNDQSVTGQVLKLIAAKPDAVLIAAVGGPAVLPQATLYDQGYKGTDLSDARRRHRRLHQARQGEGRGDDSRRGLDAGDRRRTGQRSDQEGRERLHERVRKAVRYATGDVRREHYDAGLLLQQALPVALKAAKPGTEAFRVALRDALEQEKDVVGCQGVFNMSATNHNGMDERARVLVVVKDGKFRLLPE